MDGFTVNLLPPTKLNFTDYRRGEWKKLGVKSKVDGVAFAETTHGDVFVFDRSARSDGHCMVYWYGHEQNTVEPFAESFSACVQRFHDAK